MINDKWFKENEKQILNFLSERKNRNYVMKIIRELDENDFEEDDLDSKDCAALTVKDPKDLERIQNYLKSKDERLYIFWLIGQNTGLRGGDVVKLTISDLRKAIKQGKMIVVEEKIEHIMTSRIKNNKPVRKKTRKDIERTVHLNSELIKILKEFVLGKEPSDFIYPSDSESGHYRRDSLGKAYKRALLKLKIAKESDSVGTHTPRKSYGYRQYYDNGENIDKVQDLFCHSSVKTTMRYIGLDDDEAEQAASRMNKYTHR